MPIQSKSIHSVFCLTFVYIMFCSVIVCCRPALGYQDQVAQNDSSLEQGIIKVYKLSFIPADDAHSIIAELTHGRTGARIMTDNRMNSLLVVAGAQEHQVIEELIAKIDVEKREPVAQNPPNELITISFAGINPDLVRRVLNSQLAGQEGVRMEVIDEMVVLSGDKSTVDRAKALVAQIRDSAQVEVTTPSVYLSMTFIVEGQQIEKGDLELFGKPNLKIGTVIAKSVNTGLISLKNPVVVSKTVNRVRVNHDLTINAQKQSGQEPAFVNRSESKGKGFSMSNSGYIAQVSGKTFQIDANILLTVNSQLSPQLQGSTELNTIMEVPLNHPVLLSFSTILGVDSAVILQIHEAK